MTFRQWVETNNICDLPDVVYRYAEAAWQAAQKAERERTKALVDAIKAFDEAAAQSKTIIGFAGKALGLVQKARKALAKYRESQ